MYLKIIFVCLILSCIVIFSFFTFHSGPFCCKAGQETQNSSILSIVSRENRDYVVSAIESEVPGYLIGFGISGGVGVESLDITLQVPFDEFPNIEKIAFSAYEAGKKGLNNCKKLFNYTNHDVNSPSILRIEVCCEGRSCLHSVINGNFYDFGIPIGCVGNGVSRISKGDTVFRFVSSCMKMSVCDLIETYTTKIDKDVNSVGLKCVFVSNQFGSIQDCVCLYKFLYQSVGCLVKEKWPDHFLMLNVYFDSEDRCHSVNMYNIRNNLIVFESVRNEKTGWNTRLYQLSCCLDDMVPLNMRRVFA